MAESNLQIVRRLVDAYVNEDYDAIFAIADPEIEFHGTVGGLTEGSVQRGRDEAAALLEDDADVWESVDVEAERLVEAGDRVVVLLRELRTGRESGIELEAHTAIVFELRAGRLVRLQGFMDQGEALRSVGAMPDRH